MSPDVNEMRRGLIAYLEGYGRNNPGALSAIATYDAWQALATREIERRMARFLEALPLHEVQAIARWEINFNELACRALGGLDKE